MLMATISPSFGNRLVGSKVRDDLTPVRSVICALWQRSNANEGFDHKEHSRSHIRDTTDCTNDDQECASHPVEPQSISIFPEFIDPRAYTCQQVSKKPNCS